MKLQRTIVVIALVAATAWLVWRWALPPGLWGGSMLSSSEETAEQLAHRYFGPVILQTHWLADKTIEQGQAVIWWGQIETIYRLVALVGMQLIISCGLIMFLKMRSANHTSDIRQPANGSPKPSM